MKELSVRNVAALKRNAQNVYPLVVKRGKLAAKMADLKKELDNICGQIEATETGSRLITGGFNSMDLIRRINVPTGKVVNGKEITTTKFEPIPGVLEQKEGASSYIILVNSPEVGEEPRIDNNECTPAFIEGDNIPQGMPTPTDTSEEPKDEEEQSTGFSEPSYEDEVFGNEYNK